MKVPFTIISDINIVYTPMYFHLINISLIYEAKTILDHVCMYAAFASFN